MYTIDTTATTLTGGAGPYGPGSTYQEYYPGFGSATSTIGGHAITIDASNGYSLLEYNYQLVSPPQPYNLSLLELQVVGRETTNDIGGEFNPGRSDQLSADPARAPEWAGPFDGQFWRRCRRGEWRFLSLRSRGNRGDWNLTLYILPLITEPATWAMLMLGFAGLGFAGYRASRNNAAFAA